MIRYMLLLLLLSVGSVVAFGQTTGDLQGKVKDENGEPLAFANVALYKEDALIRGTSTNFDGLYNFAQIEAGTYDLVVTYVGYPTLKTEGVIVKIGQTVELNVDYQEDDLIAGLDSLAEETVVVRGYRIPLIETDNTTGGQTLGSEDIEKLATRNISSIAATTAGVNQKDEGEELNSNGGRSSGNDVYVDGVRVIGGASIPETEIDQVQVITSGVPAEFGDATGAITNIITKGPSAQMSGGIQVETSQFLDAFGATTIDFSLGGPLMTEVKLSPSGDTLKKDGKPQRKAILGYRMAGRYATNLDSRPSALGSFRLTDEKLSSILNDPLLNVNGGIVPNAETITEDDLVEVDVRPNGRNSVGLLTAKVDYKPSEDFYFVAGGQGSFNWGYSPSTVNRLMNSDFNPYYKSSVFRVYGRFRHTISSTIYKAGADADSTTVEPVFQNFSYEVQADYTQSNNSIEDSRFEDRAWEYGYVGQIRRSLTPVVGVVDTNYIINSAGDTLGTEEVQGHAFNQVTFDGYSDAGQFGYNDGLSRYNRVVDFDAITDMEQMQVINGRFTSSNSTVFGLFNNAYYTGAGLVRGSIIGSGIEKSQSSQVCGNIKTNFDLVTNGGKVRHSIQAGGVYEQRVFRSYSMSPFSLWTLADQSANSHISNAADANSPVLDANGNPVEFFDPVTQRYYIQNNSLIRTDENDEQVSMSAFGENLRNFMGKNPEDWVNVHEMDPNDMDLAWFEPTTLILGAQQLVSYYGYDYLGNALGTNTTFDDFFNAVDANGRKTRPVAPFAPIYVAGYIQDKFKYNDIIFRIGVRFDSYDANTKVLNDPYSVTGYYTASEFTNLESGYTAGQQQGFSHPSNIGDDFAVYVNENSPDASVVGYRDGEQWYDASGNPVTTPTQLGSTIVPALRGFSTAQIDPQGEEYDPSQAFSDYDPNLVVMPRISFSFPIGDFANFYANYDILAMRPPEATLATALTYFNFRENKDLMSNPNLRSQKTINYEVGYQQKVSDNSKVKFSLLYREERDLIQARQYILAYPITYTSFGNDDFSTVKSLKVEYDMRRVKNFRFLANYTLQFAEGTGSSPTSSLAVAAEELKYIFPLDFDQRHTFFFLFDYRYGEGKKYDGPKIGKFDVLENTGANLSFNFSSGTPYTRKLTPGGIGTSFPNAVTDGSINGARMPWNFRIDLRFDRDIVIGKNSDHPIYANVYLRVQNLLNTQNVLNVYPVTGSPTEDGFLTIDDSPGLGLLASRAQSYQLLYDLRMRNPFNISRPRRIFLGARFSF
ncbi:TonB-dependent receptor [Saprospira grandis]|uniref:TonB-dependent receptor n=1 Tax=Saprospira grandis TaxID=1008 RepID=UPI0022DE7E2E|nr:TonB-dependent receptor [Saprospira grandis]WBM76076.1 TonB-dependent receptor [Saprospira grandis]